MTPEEITTSFSTAAASFQPIVGQPTDDDLTALAFRCCIVLIRQNKE
jgi:hypothetical protein